MYSANPAVATAHRANAMSAPGRTARSPCWRTFGVNPYRLAMRVIAAARSSGHFAKLHTRRAVSPSPIGSATAATTGPDSTMTSTTTVSRSTLATVTASWVGRRRQNGRPSRTSNTTFTARPNAEVYPDAPHSAPARPRASAVPARPALDVTDSIGPANASAADGGATSRTNVVSVSASANRPTIDDTAINAGNAESSA